MDVRETVRTSFARVAASLVTAVLAGTAVAAIAVPSAGAASASPAVSGPVAGVTLAQVGNDFLFAGEGVSHFGEVWWQPVGSSTWTMAAAANLGTVYSRPSIAALTIRQGLRTVTLSAMVAEGPNDSLNFWWQPLADIESGPWHQEVLGGAGTDIGIPSIAQIGDDVAVAAEGTNHNFFLFWQQIGATTWHEYYFEGDAYGAPTMATVASPPDRLGVVYFDKANFIRYLQWSYLPATLGLDSVPYIGTVGGVPTSDAPTITALDDGLTAITVQGLGRSLDSWTSSGTPFFSLTTDQALAGSVYSDVSVADLGGGVVGAAADNGAYVYFYWTNHTGGPWHAVEVGNAGTYLTPPQVIELVNSAGTRLVAIGQENPDRSVDIYWQLVGSTYWQTVSFPAGTMGG
jgi:hypothetical protein